jgi:hypothetical protein
MSPAADSGDLSVMDRRPQRSCTRSPRRALLATGRALFDLAAQAGSTLRELDRCLGGRRGRIRPTPFHGHRHAGSCQRRLGNDGKRGNGAQKNARNQDFTLDPDAPQSDDAVLWADFRRGGAKEERASLALAAIGRSVSGVHRRELVLMSPMADVVHQFSLRPLGRCSLAKAAGLGRYKDAASGLNRLRNSGKRNDGAQGDPGNYNFMDHDYPPVLQRTPLPADYAVFSADCPADSLSRRRSSSPSRFHLVSICEPFGLICRLMAMF